MRGRSLGLLQRCSRGWLGLAQACGKTLGTGVYEVDEDPGCTGQGGGEGIPGCGEAGVCQVGTSQKKDHLQAAAQVRFCIAQVRNLQAAEAAICDTIATGQADPEQG